MPEQANAITRATFTKTGGGGEISVDFNPETLRYVIANTLSDRENAQEGQSQQYVSKSSAKLTMELIFDTTDSGSDVRDKTNRMQAFMEPDEDQVPPRVDFEWGTYKFTGMFDSYQETLDFFAPDGVPLRATISLTLANQENVFEGNQAANGSGGDEEPTEAPASPGAGVTDTATQAGAPEAGREIAAANGVENMRFPGSGSLSVSGKIQLKAPAAFASGGFSLGASGGASAGAGLSLGISGGAGFSTGASAGLSVGAGISASIGGSASAGLSASAGAFAGLHTSAPKASVKLKVSALAGVSGTASLGLQAGGSVGIGGVANGSGAGCLKAHIGAPGELKAKIEFN